MKGLANLALWVAIISIVLAIISRLLMKPLPIAPAGGISAGVILSFANTCLLLAIAIYAVEALKK